MKCSFYVRLCVRMCFRWLFLAVRFILIAIVLLVVRCISCLSSVFVIFASLRRWRWVVVIYAWSCWIISYMWLGVNICSIVAARA